MNKNIYNPIISYFHGSIYNKDKPVDTTLAKMIEQIKTNESWKKKISHIRNIVNQYGKDSSEYKTAKKALHYFMPCGTFQNRSKSGIKDVNGLIQGDIDNLNPQELQRARELLVNDRHTIALFNSPSNLGIKFFIRTNVTINNPPFKPAVLHYYKSKYKLELDPSTLHLYQPCYVSFDNKAMINLQADIFTYEIKDKRDGRLERRAIDNSSSNNTQSVNYCKMVIASEAKAIQAAGRGNGGYQLNKSAFKAGTYENIGLSKEVAFKAFQDAFLSRSYSKHSEKEFEKKFNVSFYDGTQNPRKKQ